MKNIWQWLVYSSTNVDRYSLTIKSLGKFIPSAVLLFAFMNINVDSSILLKLFDSIAILVSAFASVVSATSVVYGLARKIWTSIRGTNEVILGMRYRRASTFTDC